MENLFSLSTSFLGKSIDDIDEQEKNALVAQFRRAVTRGGLSACKGALMHLNPKIADRPRTVKMILIPFFLKCTHYMVDGIWGDWNKASYRL